MDKHAKHEILKDLETRLEAYLIRWQRELGLRVATEFSVDDPERLPAASGRQKEGEEPPGPTS